MRRTMDLVRGVLWRAFALSLLGAAAVLAQGSTRTVTGTVKDAESGQPIGAAQVAVKGTTRNAIGREDGAFTISVPAGAVVLVVRHIGFTIAEVNVGAEQATGGDEKLPDREAEFRRTLRRAHRLVEELHMLPLLALFHIAAEGGNAGENRDDE